MRIINKIAIVDQNRDNSLVLFKEGIFWKLYNAHAMYFYHNIRPMKVTTRYYKGIGRYVFSLGFPNNALTKYLETIKKEYEDVQKQIDSKIVKIKNIHWKNTPNYIEWEQSHIKTKKQEERQALAKEEQKKILTVSSADTLQCKALKQSIKSFDIGNATPLYALSFIKKWQDKLHKK